jgi:WhiB family redox-sensing transcriptional regulator
MTALSGRRSDARPDRRSRAATPPPPPDWSWQEGSACKGEDLTLFFGVEGERPLSKQAREVKAIQVCMGCPVRTPCLEYAIGAKATGVWGGSTDEVRTSERRRRARKQAVA